MLTLTLLLVSAVCSTQIDQDLVEDEERTLGGLALDAGVSAQQKAITYKSAGDYTLVSIPWSGATSLAFNDTTAATLSTMGNAALLLGGLYLLSGFPVALAKSDPLGISRRFGKPAPPPKFFKKQQKKPEIKKRKLSMQRQHRPVHIERRGPGERFHAEERQLSIAEERQLPQLPSRPAFSLRPLQFRMPQLPNIRLPSLPGLRRPSRPQPAGRPQAAPAPSSRPQSAPSPASAPRPQPAAAPAARPVTAARPVVASPPVFRPQTPAPTRRPVVSQTVRPASVIAPVQTSPVQSRPVQSRPAQSRPVQPQTTRPAAPLADFGSSPFDSDPFSEFQNDDFGNEESFRDLIAAQFGDSFDLKRLPETK